MCVGATFSIRGECLLCNEPQVINAGEHTNCTKCPAGKGPVPARTKAQSANQAPAENQPRADTAAQQATAVKLQPLASVPALPQDPDEKPPSRFDAPHPPAMIFEI
jgi:hypothetical protein